MNSPGTRRLDHPRGDTLFVTAMTPDELPVIRTGKLLDYLQRAGVDALPVRDDRGTYTQQLLLFFEDDKFVVTVDPRPPTVWLKGAHAPEP